MSNLILHETIEAREVNAFLESLVGKAYGIQLQIIHED